MATKKFKGIDSIRKSAESVVGNLSTEAIMDISSDKIADSPLNEGLPMDDLDALATSLKETNGPIEPIIVYKIDNDHYELVSGHRRRKAWCELLGHPTILCRVRAYPSDPYVRFREHAVSNTETREKDPTFWIHEIKHARELLTETGFTGNDAEEKLKIHSLLGKGASPMQIARYDGFAKLTPEIQNLTSHGLSVPTLYYAAGLSEEEQRTLANVVEKYFVSHPEEELSRAAFIDMVNAIKGQRNPSGKKKDRKTPTYMDGGTKISSSLKRYARAAKTEEDKAVLREFVISLRKQLDEIERSL